MNDTKEMVRVSKPRKTLFSEGPDRGAVVIALNFKDKRATEMSKDDIISEVLDIKVPKVMIKARLLDNPVVRELAAGFAMKGKHVTVITDASDDIQTLRSLRNVNLVVNTEPPTETSNKIRTSNFPLLREHDIIRFVLRSKEDYANAKVFLNSRLVTRPLVVFSIKKSFDGFDEVLEEFQGDAEFWNFRARMCSPDALSFLANK